jgi:hypothetical protein
VTDDEFDTLLEAAFREALHDPEADDDIDMTDVALGVHGDLLEAFHSELCVRWGVTDLEIKRIAAMRQALCCYSLLNAKKNYESWLRFLSTMQTTTLTKELIQDRTRILAEVHKNLVPLDEVESLARRTLAGLGLPTTIQEFEDYDGNRCRIKLDIDACSLASDSEYSKLAATLATAGED